MKRFLLSCLVIVLSLVVSAQINVDNDILSAVKQNDLAKVKLLVEKGANVDAVDSNLATLAMWAVYAADLQMLKYLISKGASPFKKGVIYINEEKTGYYGNIAGIAAGEGKLDILKHLIEVSKLNLEDKEYDPSTKTETGWTSLQWAASNGKLNEVKYLAEKGANINADYTADRGTPLMYALQSNREEVVRYLIEKGVDVNKADISGVTAIMYATLANDFETCVLLWKQNANLTQKTNDGKTALDFSLDKNFKQIIDFLKTPDNYAAIRNKEYQTSEELNTLVVNLTGEGEYKKALPLAEKSLELVQKDGNEKNPEYINVITNLSFIYKKTGDYKKADVFYKLAADYKKKTFGEKSIEYALALNMVGVLYSTMEQHQEAIKWYKDAVYKSKLIDSTSENYIAISYNLANEYKYIKKYGDAELVLKNIIETRKKVSTDENANDANIIYTLALVYDSTNQIEKAEQSYLKAIEIQKKVSGEEDNDYIASLNSLSFLYLNTKKYQKAEPIYISLTKYYKQHNGENHPYYAISLKNLANNYKNQASYSKAETLFLDAIDIQQRALGKDDPDYAESLKNLADLYKKTKQYAKSEKYYVENLAILKKLNGEENIDYAYNLNGLANLYLEMGDYEKAEPLYIRIRNLYEKIKGVENNSFIVSLNNLAWLYKNMNLFEKSVSIYKEAIEIRKKISGENDPAYISNVNDLGEIYSAMGELEKAKELFVMVMEKRKKISGENNVEYANSLNNLAVLYKTMGLYNKAELIYVKAKEIYKSILGQEDLFYATALDNLANLYNDIFQFDKAELLFMQAAQIRKIKSGVYSDDYSRSLNNLAGLFTRRGQYKEAEKLYLESLEIKKQIIGEMHFDYAATLNNLALNYDHEGEYEKAEELYLQALKIKEKTITKKNPSYAISLNNIASLYQQMGQLKNAEKYFKEALEIRKVTLGELHPDYAVSLNNLGILYTDMDENDKAELLFLQAKAIQEKVLGVNSPDYATTLNNLASWYKENNDFNNAKSLFLQVLQINKNSIGENSRAYASALNNLGNLYISNGEYLKAESALTQAKEITKKLLGENHSDYASVLDNLSQIYFNTNQYYKGEPLLFEKIRIRVQTLKNIFTTLSEKEKGYYLEKNKGTSNSNNSLLFNRNMFTPALQVNNFNLLLFLKSLSLTDTRSMLESVSASTDSVILKLLKNWQAGKSLLAQQYSLPLNNRIKNLDSIEAKAEILEKELTRRSSAFRNQQNAINISMNDLQGKLQRDEVVIEFVSFQLYNKKWTDSTMYAAYILRKNDSVPVFIPLCEQKQLGKYFTSVAGSANIQSIYRSDPIDENDKPSISGDSLYALIWKPLLPYLKGIKKVNYSPAGLLYKVAFYALPTGDSSLLMDKYELNQYTSTRQLAISEEKKESKNSIALFGNCLFSMDSISMVKNITATENANNLITASKERGNNTAGWKQLNGTSIEINSIKSLFEKNKFSTSSYEQETAIEEQFKSLSGHSPTILHLATHGFFLQDPLKKKQEGLAADTRNAFTLADDPLLRSGIVLSGANRVWGGEAPIVGREDGIVTAYEIAQMDLSGTDLVVLSACETALGDIKGNEGVFGLQRAFKLAGVKNMILSLWKVPDAETAELMKIFYSYYLNGKNIRDSFAAAQKEMRKKYAPYYWAAFVLIE